MAVRPVVKGVYACDEVLADPTSGKVSLLNSFVTVRPTGEFPFELGRLSVAVALRSGRGLSRVRVDVVQLATATVTFRTREREVRFLDPLMTVYALFRLEKVRFPTHGRYAVEVYADGEFLDDEVLTVLAGAEGEK